MGAAPWPAAVGAMMVSVLSSVSVATSVLLSTKVVLISLPLKVIGNTLDLMLVMVVTNSYHKNPIIKITKKKEGKD